MDEIFELQMDKGLPSKIKESIELLRKHEPPEGYYVAFSGGKDSIVMYDLVKKSGVKYDVYYNATGIDPPELVKFIRKYYPEVKFNYPKRTMSQLIVHHKGFLPLNKMRYCCAALKEVNGNGRVVATGVRAQESPRRAKRKRYENNIHTKEGRYLHVIFDWTTDEIWKYIKENDMPYCCLYDEGRERIGCILCPLQSAKAFKFNLERYPSMVNYYIKSCDKALKKRAAEGNPMMKHGGGNVLRVKNFSITG